MNKRFAAVVFAIFSLVLSLPLSGLAQSVRVGIGFTIPPYVIRNIDGGLEVDVIRESFGAVGIKANFVYLPNLRMPVAFAGGSVDCIVSNVEYDLAEDSGRPTYDSDVTVILRNYAISLEKKGLTITSVGDLADKSVLGFNNANKYLGGEFAEMAEGNKRYSELADQALQVRMLYSGRVDVVVSDKRIFLYWRKQLTPNREAAEGLDQKVVFHPIFSPSARHVSFGDRELRALFNRGLGILRETGRVKAIEAQYSNVENE